MPLRSPQDLAMAPMQGPKGKLVEGKLPSRHGSACGSSDERGAYGDWGESSGSSGQGTSSICGFLRAGATGGPVVGSPIAGSRLSQEEDGRYAYQTKKGVTLVLTAEQLVKRLLWLIPPARMHLTSFHGVFASHAKERARVTPQGNAVEEKVAPSSQMAAKSKAPAKP